MASRVGRAPRRRAGEATRGGSDGGAREVTVASRDDGGMGWGEALVREKVLAGILSGLLYVCVGRVGGPVGPGA